MIIPLAMCVEPAPVGVSSRKSMLSQTIYDNIIVKTLGSKSCIKGQDCWMGHWISKTIKDLCKCIRSCNLPDCHTQR
jgi:hypothetical protein